MLWVHCISNDKIWRFYNLSNRHSCYWKLSYFPLYLWCMLSGKCYICKRLKFVSFYYLRFIFLISWIRNCEFSFVFYNSFVLDTSLGQIFYYVASIWLNFNSTLSGDYKMTQNSRWLIGHYLIRYYPFLLLK